MESVIFFVFYENHKNKEKSHNFYFCYLDSKKTRIFADELFSIFLI
jgi:hypothetical protein